MSVALSILVDYLAIVGVLTHVIAAGCVWLWYAAIRALRSIVVPT